MKGGKAYGEGKWTSSLGKETFIGTWVDDKLTGYGKCTIEVTI